MIVPAETSFAIVNEEIKQCEGYSKKYGWNISSPVLESHLFTVRMTSPEDKEEYILEVDFENYRRWPLLLEFIDPITKEKGVKNAYPKCKGTNASFFHDKPCICHPCSRKAYKGYSDIHSDWGELDGWSQNKDIGSLKSIPIILDAIYKRISNPEFYNGRLSGQKTNN